MKALVKEMKGARYVLLVKGREVDLEQTLVVGRGALSDVVIQQDADVSRQHARFWATARGVYVEDLNSTNGTLVDGELLKRPRLLKNNDVVRVGSTLLQIRLARDVMEIANNWAESTPALGTRWPTASSDTTRPADIFEALERAVVGAVEAGSGAEAERIASSHLDRFLGEVRAGWETRQHVDRVLSIAMALARVPGSARWLNYLLALHGALGRQPGQAVVALLQAASDPGAECGAVAARADVLEATDM